MITRTDSFRAIAEAVVPEAGKLDASSWAAFDAIIERALTQRPARIRRQLELFLSVINVLAVLKHGRPIRQLIPPIRTEFLEGLQKSRLLLVRRGFWGIRTLVLMGYYARPEVAADLGYTARLRGWSAQ